MAVQGFFVSLPLIQQACSSGRWVRTLWNSLAATATRGFRSHQRTSHRAKRTFSERYLLPIQLRNLKLYQKVSQGSVHVGCIISRCQVAIIGSLHYLYNTRRRGLAELLILIKGQCEGLSAG